MAITETATALPATAQAPFDDHQADVILRTSDNVDFYVYRVVLSLASPFFKQMFSLAQPAGTQTNPAADSDIVPSAVDGSTLPIIPFTEDSQTIDYLLRLCYPVTDPTPSSDLSMVARVLEAALKYELEEATALLKTLILTFASSDPLKVFAISCRLRLEHEAGIAAQSWRDDVLSKGMSFGNTCQTTAHSTSGVHVTPCKEQDCRFRDFAGTAAGSSYIAEMKTLSAGCYYRLNRFVRTGAMTQFCDPTPTSDVPSLFTTLTNTSTPPLLVPDPAVLARWPADIVLKSSDGVLIHTHQFILVFVSAEAILEKAQDVDCPSYGGLPLVILEEDGATLIGLLRILHPLGATSGPKVAHTFEQARSVWAAAQKYSMDKVAEVARRELVNFLDQAPLRVYFTAVRLRWIADAKEAAQYCARQPFLEDNYVSEMESSSAESLFYLYAYLHESRRANASVLTRYQKKSQPGTASENRSSGAVADIPMIAAPLVIRHLQEIRSKCSSHGYSSIVGDCVRSANQLLAESYALQHDVRNAVSDVNLEITL